VPKSIKHMPHRACELSFNSGYNYFGSSADDTVGGKSYICSGVSSRVMS